VARWPRVGSALATATVALNWPMTRSDEQVVFAGELAEQLRLADMMGLMDIEEEDPLPDRSPACVTR
jgi:hypothetical protein